MAGAPVPEAGEIGLDTITNAAQEILLENQAEALRRQFGVGTPTITPNIISAGQITPSLGIIAVDTEGGVANDFLDAIDPANYQPMSVILVFAYQPPAKTVTLRDQATFGAGDFILAGGVDFVLDDSQKSILFRLTQSLNWKEIGREWGGDTVGARAGLGLGTVALLDDGAVDAATLQTIPASGFLAAGATAVNSSLLTNLGPSSFLRADIGGEQQMAGTFRGNSGILKINHPSVAGASQLQLANVNVVRGQVFYDGVNNLLEIRFLDTDQSTKLGAIRIVDGTIPEWFNPLTSSYEPFLQRLNPPFPGLGRVMWDKLTVFQQFAPGTRYVMQTADLPQLPGTTGSGVYRIHAGITAGKVGTSSPRWTVQVCVGPAGDETDTIVAESIEYAASAPVFGELPEEVYSISVGAKVTLVLNLIANNAYVYPSVVNGFSMTKQTFLRVEQLG